MDWYGEWWENEKAHSFISDKCLSFSTGDIAWWFQILRLACFYPCLVPFLVFRPEKTATLRQIGIGWWSSWSLTTRKEHLALPFLGLWEGWSFAVSVGNPKLNFWSIRNVIIFWPKNQHISEWVEFSTWFDPPKITSAIQGCELSLCLFDTRSDFCCVMPSSQRPGARGVDAKPRVKGEKMQP